MPREIVVGDVVRYVKPPLEVAISEWFEQLVGLDLVVTKAYTSHHDGIRYLNFNSSGNGLGFAARFFRIVGDDDYTLGEITA